MHFAYNKKYPCVVKRFFKAAVLKMLKKYKMKTILNLTVNTGQVMFSGEFYFTDPLIQLTNRW